MPGEVLQIQVEDRLLVRRGRELVVAIDFVRAQTERAFEVGLLRQREPVHMDGEWDTHCAERLEYFRLAVCR